MLTRLLGINKQNEQNIHMYLPGYHTHRDTRKMYQMLLISSVLFMNTAKQSILSFKCSTNKNNDI